MSLLLFLHRLSTTFHDSCFLVVFSCVCRCYYFCIGFPRLSTTVAFWLCSVVYVVAIIFASTFHDFSRRFLLSRALSCMSLQLFSIGFSRLSTTIAFKSCSFVYVVAIISASTFHDFPRQLLFGCVQLCMSLQSFCIGFSRLSTTIAFKSCLVVYVVAIIQHRLFTTFHDNYF